MLCCCRFFSSSCVNYVGSRAGTPSSHYDLKANVFFLKKTKPIFFWVRHIQKTFFEFDIFKKHSLSSIEKVQFLSSLRPDPEVTAVYCSYGFLVHTKPNQDAYCCWAATRSVLCRCNTSCFFFAKNYQKLASWVLLRSRFVYSAQAQKSLRTFRWKKCLTTIARQSKTEADIYFFSKKKLIK